MVYMSRTDSGVHPDVLWKYGSRPPKPRGGFPNEFANCVRFQTASKSHCRCGLESSKSCTSSKSCFAYSTHMMFFLQGLSFSFVLGIVSVLSLPPVCCPSLPLLLALFPFLFLGSFDLAQVAQNGTA